jgi:hypothetical protein
MTSPQNIRIAQWQRDGKLQTRGRVKLRTMYENDPTRSKWKKNYVFRNANPRLKERQKKERRLCLKHLRAFQPPRLWHPSLSNLRATQVHRCHVDCDPTLVYTIGICFTYMACNWLYLSVLRKILEDRGLSWLIHTTGTCRPSSTRSWTRFSQRTEQDSTQKQATRNYGVYNTVALR